MHKLKSLLGIKEYLLEITWNKGEKEVIRVETWSKNGAIIKVAKEKDYFYYDPHAEMKILN